MIIRYLHPWGGVSRDKGLGHQGKRNLKSEFYNFFGRFGVGV